VRNCIERSQLWNIIEQVRNLILNWALELEKAGVLGEDMHFSEQEKGEAKPVTQQFIIQNVGVLGNVTDQATVTNQQTATAKIELDLGQVRDFLSQARAALPQLPEKAQKEIRPVLETIERELKTEKPNSSKIRPALGSLRKIGEGVASNLTAQGIIAMVKAIVGA
jgi:AbiTii